MRTEDLIQALAADTKAQPRALPQRRLAMAALAGAAIALALVLVWLGLRADLSAGAVGGFFWVKTAYTAALALAGYWATERLSRPGAPVVRAWILAGTVFAVCVALGLAQFIGMEADQRMPALRGGSWSVCSRNILLLAAPMTVIALLAVRTLAPTRPTWAGFAAGVFSGATAATVYGLHCPEATLVFVALWYSLGILACGALGAVLGSRLLRW